ncbi:F-box associated domain containing protein [Tanacetum coccineum]
MFGKSVNVVELDNLFTLKGSTTRIIGSCNELLCIVIVVSGSSTIFIWNPSTRRVNRLPSSGEFSNTHFEFGFGFDELEYFNPYVGFGFWYDESNDDYKVVELTSDHPIHGLKTRVKIYSLKSGYWKRLICDLTCDFLIQSHGMFFNGALHWITGRTIVSLDLATETFGEILQPVRDIYLTLCTFGESLSVVCNLFRESRLDVWVMKVYGVQDSWTKLVSIPHLTLSKLHDAGFYRFLDLPGAAALFLTFSHFTEQNPEKVLIREEAIFHVTKNVNSISITREEEERGDMTDVTPDNTEMPTETKKNGEGCRNE